MYCLGHPVSGASRVFRPWGMGGVSVKQLPPPLSISASRCGLFPPHSLFRAPPFLYVQLPPLAAPTSLPTPPISLLALPLPSPPLVLATSPWLPPPLGGGVSPPPLLPATVRPSPLVSVGPLPPPLRSLDQSSYLWGVHPPPYPLSPSSLPPWSIWVSQGPPGVLGLLPLVVGGSPPP